MNMKKVLLKFYLFTPILISKKILNFKNTNKYLDYNMNFQI